MGHIGAELGGPAEPEHGIQVGAVHVNLAAVIVNDRADFTDCFFEDAVGGRIGDHQRTQRVGVLLRLSAQIGHFDIAVLVTGDDDDLHTRHVRAGGIRAVRRVRNDHLVPLLSLVCEVLLCDQHPDEFTMSAGRR